jgi:hypothetical protein
MTKQFGDPKWKLTANGSEYKWKEIRIDVWNGGRMHGEEFERAAVIGGPDDLMKAISGLARKAGFKKITKSRQSKGMASIKVE